MAQIGRRDEARSHAGGMAALEWASSQPDRRERTQWGQPVRRRSEIHSRGADFFFSGQGPAQSAVVV